MEIVGESPRTTVAKILPVAASSEGPRKALQPEPE